MIHVQRQLHCRSFRWCHTASAKRCGDDPAVQLREKIEKLGDSAAAIVCLVPVDSLAFLRYNQYTVGKLLQRFCTGPVLVIVAEALHNASLGVCYADEFPYDIAWRLRQPIRRNKQFCATSGVTPMAIADLVARVAPVFSFKGGSQQASASGFFYIHADELYFITNRHVVVKEEDDYFPDELRLRPHTDPNNIRQNGVLSLQLYDDVGEPLWLEHPIGQREVDVVALPLDEAQVTSSFFIRVFTTANHIPADVEISVGEDVLVVGYPLGFHDTLHNLPIFRNAIMASVYPVPFEGKPVILIDSRLHRGTSGSPVLTKPAQMIRRSDGSTSILGQPASFLVGVHSATIDVLDRDPDQDEPLGLNVVWFASLIPDIVEQRGA